MVIHGRVYFLFLLFLEWVVIHSWFFSCIISGSFDWKGSAFYDLWTQGEECVKPSMLQLPPCAINTRLCLLYFIHSWILGFQLQLCP